MCRVVERRVSAKKSFFTRSTIGNIENATTGCPRNPASPATDTPIIPASNSLNMLVWMILLLLCRREDAIQFLFLNDSPIVPFQKDRKIRAPSQSALH
mmetsp:Transcript_29656/g.54308  ORF Transcript_29656/g.54308 Transcript_29656/m.54308 type:complete len:98 (-) Transcript_29656:68-361(-)